MMSKLQRKLRSRTGASMLLALVFLLFCSFIGGSVLVSATANAYRVAQVAEQQDFLNQRSAALLLGDRLQLDDGKQLRLTVVNANRSVQQIEVGDGGVVTPVGDPQTELVISFQLMTNVTTLTEMQHLMLENTIWRYLQQNLQTEKTYKVKLIGFGSDFTNLDGFWSSAPGVRVLSSSGNTSKVQLADSDAKIEGTMEVSGSWNATQKPGTQLALPSYSAYYSSGKGEELYDFHVDFGELSQLRLTMNAFSGTSDPITLTNTTDGYMPNDESESTKVDMRITTVSTTTSISWDDPKVEKGGAEA